MKWKHKLLVSILVAGQFVAFGGFFAPTQVAAQESAFCRRQIGGFFGLPTWYKYVLDDNRSTAECELEPLRASSGGVNTDYLLKIGLAVFEIVMRVAGMAAVGFVIYGGFQFMSSTGEPEKIAGARTTIANALIGLGIAVLAVTIVNFIGQSI